MTLIELASTPGRRHYQVLDQDRAYFVTYAPEYGESIYCWICGSYLCAHAQFVRDTDPVAPAHQERAYCAARLGAVQHIIEHATPSDLLTVLSLESMRDELQAELAGLEDGHD